MKLNEEQKDLYDIISKLELKEQAKLFPIWSNYVHMLSYYKDAKTVYNDYAKLTLENYKNINEGKESIKLTNSMENTYITLLKKYFK